MLILEITSAQIIKYKSFLTIGLLNDGDSFRTTLADDLNCLFPKKENDKRQ